jgi:mannose-6-phosphate isomerase-like protein (cupin superfamily)
MKRIVTAHDPKGKSIFVSEGEPPKRVRMAGGGLEITEVWGTEDAPTLPSAHGDPTMAPHPYFPAPGGTRFVIVRFPPAGSAEQAGVAVADPAAAAKEFFDQFPGLAELMEPDHPGMHASPTVDYLVVLSGEIELELDDGVKRRLRAGDCAVQNGTRHAWRNPGNVDCVLVAVVIGARRDGRRA